MSVETSRQYSKVVYVTTYDIVVYVSYQKSRDKLSSRMKPVAAPGDRINNLIYMRRLGCMCNTNGRPNGLPDLDQNLGMDSHSPWG